MPKFDISISYMKTVDASDKEEAERIAESICSSSNLDSEYGPFRSLDVFVSVEAVAEDEV